VTTPLSELEALASALSDIPDSPMQVGPLSAGRALFVGSGDSLAACQFAEQAGHRALSAGDLAWTNQIPPTYETVVGVSHSGQTEATVRSLELAKEAGLRTVAITANSDSAITAVAEDVILVPQLNLTETIPASGYVLLALAVFELVGRPIAGGAQQVGKNLATLATCAETMTTEIPPTSPHGISILTLPDMRSAGDFWSLKIIEATGVSARSVPLEESGHVDFFIGPQPHLTIPLIGTAGQPRHAQLCQALAANGQTVVGIDAARLLNDAGTQQHHLTVAAFGAYLAHTLSERWNLPPFRSGQVPMDASHIQMT
jgi:SIS domain-containing protein